MLVLPASAELSYLAHLSHETLDGQLSELLAIVRGQALAGSGSTWG